jgi:FdhD protein
MTSVAYLHRKSLLQSIDEENYRYIQMNKAHATFQFAQVEAGRLEIHDSDIIVEAPVSLTVNGELWFTLMCTPIQQEELAVGFLFNEGLIQSNEEIIEVRVCPTGDNVDIWLSHAIEEPTSWRRTSGCTGGMTSVDSKIEIVETTGIELDQAGITASQISGLISRLFDSQDIYRQTGGVHTSALSDGNELIHIAEDVGRHNTLDKLAGASLMAGNHPSPCVLVTTGRISSEMLQKARRMGATIVVSRTSPSSLSIQLAEQWGITLVGYARRNRFNIYTYPSRINIQTKRIEDVKQASALQTDRPANPGHRQPARE